MLGLLSLVRKQVQSQEQNGNTWGSLDWSLSVDFDDYTYKSSFEFSGDIIGYCWAHQFSIDEFDMDWAEKVANIANSDFSSLFYHPAYYHYNKKYQNANGKWRMISSRVVCFVSSSNNLIVRLDQYRTDFVDSEPSLLEFEKQSDYLEHLIQDKREANPGKRYP